MDRQFLLSPPFSRATSSELAGPKEAWNPITPATFHGNSHRIVRVSDREVKAFLMADLDVSRLNALHSHLWYAGRARCCRALHRQRMIDRQIVITEQADLHMVWYESRILVKPLPEYLLDHQFWDMHIRDVHLHASACGFLLSYTWLMSHPSDLHIAHELKLVPAEVSWQAWTAFVDDLLSRVDFEHYTNVNKRYRYGELRLHRLSTIYRLTHLSFHGLLRGYLYLHDQYSVFFGRKLAWSLVAFLYVSTLLAALQLCLATERFQHNQDMQTASVVFGVFSIFLPAAVAGLAFCFFVVIYIMNFMRALGFGKSWRDVQ